MARIEWVHHRLLRWRAVRVGGVGRMGYARVDLLGVRAGPRTSWDRPLIDPRQHEANATEAAVNAMPPKLRQAVLVHYLGDYSVPDQAAAIGCSVATLYARLDRACQALAKWWK